MMALAYFLVGAVSMLLLAAIARFVARLRLSDDVAAVAGFTFALGCAFAGGFRGVRTSGYADEAALNLGMIVGLICVWHFFFKRMKALG